MEWESAWDSNSVLPRSMIALAILMACSSTCSVFDGSTAA